MTTRDKRIMMAGIAGLMVLAAAWFWSPWPLVALASMGFVLLLASAWAEADKSRPQ